MNPSGVVWCVGAPGYGKTWKAHRLLLEANAATGRASLVLDAAGDLSWPGFRRTSSIAEAIVRVFDLGQHVILNVATAHARDVERVFAAILAVGDVNVLVDESAYWINARRGTSSALLRLFRAHRHAQVWLFLTTQHFSGDVPQEALSCEPDVYVFRCIAPAVLERLETQYGIERARVSGLAVGEFVLIATRGPAKIPSSPSSAPPTDRSPQHAPARGDRR